MSKWGQLTKHAEDFMLEEFYKKMTPEQYKKGIQTAIERTKKDMATEYEKDFKRLQKEYTEEMSKQAGQIIDTISVEFIYELAKQMDTFNETDEDLRSQKIDRVQEIYDNTMGAIKKYADYKNENQASREYTKKKKLVLKMFKLKF